MATGKTLRRWPLPNGFWDQVQFDGTGRLLLLRREQEAKEGRRGWRLYQLGDSDKPTLLCEQTNRSWETFGLAMAPGGRHFVVSDVAGSRTNCVLRVYDTSGGELWKASSPRCESGLMVRLDPSGHQFAYLNAGSPDRFTLMEFEGFKAVSTLPTLCAALSPIGQGLDDRGWVYLDHFNPDKMLPMVTMDWSRNYLRCFSTDGRFVAQATDEGVLIISDIEEVKRRLFGL